MIRLELKVEEVNYVLSALAKRPIEEASDLFDKIKSEGQKQMQEQKSKDGLPVEVKANKED